MTSSALFLSLLFSIISLVSAQLSGSVGPTTSTASKAAKKICNVLDYGAKADQSTDLGPALYSAWSACKTGGIVYIPPGNYAMSTWQTLSGGSGWALQLDGVIYRTGTDGGHMILVQKTSDFEFFSRTSQGAIQGYGYTFHSQNKYGPRLIRLVSVDHWSFHDIKLVDAPQFHLFIATCTNGEVYNVIIRGANRGGLDGIDVSGSNIWLHDISVTNRDECITIKSPSTNMRVENIYCNWSGGCAIGSLGSDTAISNIQYNNIYTWQSNNMLMIKSSGGSGYVKDSSFTNFIGHSNAYGIDVDQHWSSQTVADGAGVALSNLKFQNWQGTIIDAKRAPINMNCDDEVPCKDITLSNIAFWSDTNKPIKYFCESAYGSGYCLKSGSGGAYSVTTTISSAPAGYSGAKMADDLPAGLGLSVSIAIPKAIPTSFYPGVKPISALLNGGGAGAANVVATSTMAPAATSVPADGTGCADVYAQCGGTGWAGATCCAGGSTCTVSSQYYSQCLP